MHTTNKSITCVITASRAVPTHADTTVIPFLVSRFPSINEEREMKQSLQN